MAALFALTGVATHPEVAPTAAAMRLSLCEDALGQVQPWQWIRCRIPYRSRDATASKGDTSLCCAFVLKLLSSSTMTPNRSTDAGIKSRLADPIQQYTLGTLGGTVQRRQDATVVTIEGTYENVRAVLQWMEQTMRYLQAQRAEFKLLQSCPEPRSEHSSGNVADEGTSVSSLSDVCTPSRIS